MIERLSKLMTSSLRRAGVEKQVKTAFVADVVLEVLQKKFGPLMSITRVKKFKDKIVTIVCETSVLAEEIRLAEPNLIKEINTRLESNQVERIIAIS